MIERECTKCGHKETRSIPKLENNDNTALTIGLIVGLIALLLIAGLVVFRIFKRKKKM